MHKDCFLFLDNADDSNVDLSNYIPQCDHGNVIITSRLTEVHQMASPGSHLNFSDLEKSEAVNLLLKHAHEYQAMTISSWQLALLMHLAAKLLL